MAVAASLNVNLTATSGQFTSTMTKATKTMQTVGATATGIGRAVKGLVVAAAVKKAFNFITHAVGDLEDLATSAEKAGFGLSKIERDKLGTAQVAAEKMSGAFDKMKLQLVAGLAPAIQHTAEIMTWFTNQSVIGLSAMELVGKAVGVAVIIAGKTFQGGIKLIAKGLVPIAETVAGITAAIAEAAVAMGDIETGSKFAKFSIEAGKAAQDLKGIDASVDWDKIFSWPELKITSSNIQSEAKKIKDLEAPKAIGFGSQESALFDFKRRESMIRSKQEKDGQKPADKQLGVLNTIHRDLVRLIQLQGETTVLTA